MNYEEFKRVLFKRISEILPPDVRVEKADAEKNNSVHYEILNFVPVTDINMAMPVLYMESLYSMYKETGSINSVIYHVKDALDARVYIDKDVLSNLPIDRVFTKMVNAKRNQYLLGKVPCKRVGDFLFTYHILFSKDINGVASGRITNELFKEYNISLKELDIIAMNNTQEIFPIKFQKMQDELLEGELETKIGDTDKIYVDSNEKNDIYILTNQSKMDGATVLFYPGVKEALAEQFPEGAYIIPFSVDEVLIISYDVVFESQMTEENMLDIIKEANSKLLKPEEILGDELYFLDGETAEISKVHGKKKEYVKADIQIQDSWTSEGKRLYRSANKSLADSENVMAESKLENGQNIEPEIDIEP